jgi:hypothetical protein
VSEQWPAILISESPPQPGVRTLKWVQVASE